MSNFPDVRAAYYRASARREEMTGECFPILASNALEGEWDEGEIWGGFSGWCLLAKWKRDVLGRVRLTLKS